MNKTLIKIIFLISPFLISQIANAETVKFRAMGAVNYEQSSVFSSKPPKDTEGRAVSLAIDAAWDKYVSGFSDAKRNAYSIVKRSILDRRDDFIIGHRVIDKINDEDNKKYTVQVRVEIDDSAIQKIIFDSTKKGNESGEYFSWIFVTRAQDSVKSYMDKVTKINKAESGGSDIQDVVIDGNSTAVTQEKSSYKKSTSGGSTEKKRDKVKWTKLSSKEIDAAMGEALVNAGYEAVDFGDLHSEGCSDRSKSVEEIRDEFVENTDLPKKTESAIKRTAKDCEVKYTAIGSLDIMMQQTDPVTGLIDVTVSVIAKVYDTSKRFPKQIASVGPVQHHGLGDSEQVARSNALKESAKQAANTMINQLRAR